VLGSGSPDSFSKRYALLPISLSTRNGPSQLGENLPLCLRALLAILQTRSPLWKDRGFSLELYLLAALNLAAKSRIPAFSLISYRRSRCVLMQSVFNCVSWCCCRIKGSPTSTGMTALIPYTSVYCVSRVEDWGCICMPIAPRVIHLAICLLPHLTVSSVVRGESCWRPQIGRSFAGVRRSLLYV